MRGKPLIPRCTACTAIFQICDFYSIQLKEDISFGYYQGHSKAGSGAPSGTQSLKIKQMAKAGYMTGAEIKADSEKTTLAQLGYTGGDAKLEVRWGTRPSPLRSAHHQP